MNLGHKIMDPAAIQQAIATYGYWALFIGTFIEGETFFILGGIAAQKGLLNPYYVAIVAMLGGFVGDQLFFFLGLWRGEQLLKRFKRLGSRAQQIRRLIRRHAVALMLTSRFLYGFRVVVPLACGTAGVPPRLFVMLNFISALLWSVSFGALGYLFGSWIFTRLEGFRQLQTLVAIVLGVVVATFLLGRWLRRRLMEGQEGHGQP